VASRPVLVVVISQASLANLAQLVAKLHGLEARLAALESAPESVSAPRR
jgi:hypothetical protein